jgi:hypothetical protein
MGKEREQPADDEAGLPHLRITAPAPAVADQGEQQAVVHGEFVTVPLLVLLHAVLVATQKLGIIQREGERSQGKVRAAALLGLRRILLSEQVQVRGVSFGHGHVLLSLDEAPVVNVLAIDGANQTVVVPRGELLLVLLVLVTGARRIVAEGVVFAVFAVVRALQDRVHVILVSHVLYSFRGHPCVATGRCLPLTGGPRPLADEDHVPRFAPVPHS